MTVAVGRTQIHLGWETLIGLIVFTVATTWEISGYKNSQDNKLDKIIAWQKEHGTKDSTYYSKVDANTADISELKKRTNQVNYLVERKINARVILTTTNN